MPKSADNSDYQSEKYMVVGMVVGKAGLKDVERVSLVVEKMEL